MLKSRSFPSLYSPSPSHPQLRNPLLHYPHICYPTNNSLSFIIVLMLRSFCVIPLYLYLVIEIRYAHFTIKNYKHLCSNIEHLKFLCIVCGLLFTHWYAGALQNAVKWFWTSLVCLLVHMKCWSQALHTSASCYVLHERFFKKTFNGRQGVHLSLKCVMYYDFHLLDSLKINGKTHSNNELNKAVSSAC